MKHTKQLNRKKYIKNIDKLNQISDTLGNMTRIAYLGNLTNKKVLVGGQSNLTSSDSLGDMVSDRAGDIINSFFKAFVNLADNFVPVFSQAALGNLAEVPYEVVAPELQKNKELVEFIMNDPVTRKALKELIKTYIEFLIELYQLNEPEIIRLQDTFWEGMKEFAQRSGRGFSNTALNFIETAIANVPIAGGAIDIVISVMRGFNNFMLASSPIIENSLKGIATVNRIKNEMNDFISENSYKLQQTMDNFNAASQRLSQKLDKPYQFTGGGNGKIKNRKKNNKYIKRTLKRIYKSISRFTRRNS